MALIEAQAARTDALVATATRRSSNVPEITHTITTTPTHPDDV